MMFLMNGISHVSHPSPLSMAVSVLYSQNTLKAPGAAAGKAMAPFFQLILIQK